MNLQEAVGWLLENNALPFQSTANYVANTEIAMSTLVNPSPAKVRVGSLIFFADSKVSTVIGVTSNSFIVSDQYNDLVDDIVYVSNVAINASGHLICTLSNGDTIDAGLIKQVNNFSIDASQHLIVNYNDGTSTDLGAIFSGNVNIAGNFTADSIIENMSGYSFTLDAPNDLIKEINYAGVVKNGNKITYVLAGVLKKLSTFTAGAEYIGTFTFPSSIGAKLYPNSLGQLANGKVAAFYDNVTSVDLYFIVGKLGNSQFRIRFYNLSNLVTDNEYGFRFEVTFLLSDSLI